MGYQLEGKTVFQGIKVSIENSPGSVRSGVDRDGKEWSTQMELVYGRIPYVQGADDDALDVFIDQSNPMAEKVFVVHIKHPDTGAYDEDKCFLGFDTEKEVKEAFKLHYDGWTRFWGGVTEYSVDEFKEALKQGGVNLKKSIGSELWDSVVVSGIGKSNPDDIEEFIDGELEGADEYTEAAKEHPEHAKTFKKIAKDEKKHRGMLKRVLAKLKISKVKKAKPLGEKTKGKPMEDIGDDIVKAVAIKGRAGLALVPVSTKSGRMTKKWKRVAPKAKKETGPAQPKKAMTPHLFRWKGKNGKQNEQVMLLTPETSKAPMKEFRKQHRNTKDVYFRKITTKEFDHHESGGTLADYNIGGVRGNFDEFHKVPVDVIEPDPTQPRKEFDPVGLRQLARTFKNVTQLQNIILRPHPDKPDKFIILGGERRWRASQLVGITHLESKIMNPPEHLVHEIQTIENYSRKQMTSSEDATAFLNMYNAALKRLSKKTQAKAKKGMIIGDARDFVAERMGVSKETVRKMLSVSIRLDPQIQRLMGKEGGISNAVAYSLSQLPQDRQPMAMNKVSKMKDTEAIPILNGMIAALKSQPLFGDSFQLESERIKQPELEQLEKLAVHQKRASSYSKMIGGVSRLLSKVAKEGGISTLVSVLLKYDEKKKSPAQRLKEIVKIEQVLKQVKNELTKAKHQEAILAVAGAQGGLFKAIARVLKKKSDIVKGAPIKGRPGLYFDPQKHRWVRHGKPISSFEAAKHLIQNTKTLRGYYGIQNRLERLAGEMSKSERTKMEKVNADRAQYHGDKDLRKVGAKPVNPEKRGAGMDTGITKSIGGRNSHEYYDEPEQEGNESVDYGGGRIVETKGIIRKVLDFFKAAPMNPESGKAHLVKRPTLVRRKTGSKMEMRWVSVEQKTKEIRHKKQEDAPDQKGKKAEEGTAEHKGHWMNIRGHKIFVPESDNRTIAAVDDHDKSGHLVGSKLSSSDHKRFMMNTGQMERDKPRSKDAKREGDIKKFKRVKKLARKLPKITEQIKKDLGRQDNDIRRVRAAILSIMLKANVRVGNPGSAQFGVKGATTLSKDDITLHGDGVVQLKFTGKSGVSWDKVITSPELENALKEFMAQTDDSSEPIMKFRTKDGGLREFQDVDLRKNWKEKHGILPKDIRTWSASTMAFKELRRLSELSKGKKLKKTEVKKLMKQAIEKVASEMGHTPAMAKNNYIAPFILHDFMKNGGRFSIDEAKFEVAPKSAKL